jgi:chromosome segregation ATPase
MSKVLLVVILMMGGIGYWYYNDSQERMKILQENNATLKANQANLEQAIATQQETMEQLQKDFEAAAAENAALQEAYTAIRNQNRRLADKLEKIDLEAAAIANAEGIERAVNRGTENAGRCFEILSGSPLTEEELNAENEIAFNKECPWLWPGNDPERVSGQ